MAVLPFRGEFGDPLDLAALAAINHDGDASPLLEGVLRDPHLAALDSDLDFAAAARQSRSGHFDERAFLDSGQQAITRYIRRSRAPLRLVFTRHADPERLLRQKLVAVAAALRNEPTAPRPGIRPSCRVEALFGRLARRLPLAHVPMARPLAIDEAFPGASRYAWRVATAHGSGRRAAGTARIEVGRAVFVDDVDVDARTGAVRIGGAGAGTRIRTEVVVKGVGATPFTANRFSARASGVLTMLQGERDWRHSTMLARGGVPVYRPLELTLLPYCHWHPTMGWRPMVVYARLPLENLRVSDLELLPPSRGRHALDEVRRKLATLAGAEPADIDPTILVRVVVARLGRIAGLCQGGTTLGGRPFFHGFLHWQNVSLLGELVDLGEGRFVDDRRALQRAYARSGYVDPAKAWTASVRAARDELAVFHQVARRFARVTNGLLRPGRRTPPGLDRLFARTHAEGRAGTRADDVAELVQAAMRGTP